MTRDTAKIERDCRAPGSEPRWTLTFGGTICRCDDAPGLRHLAFLLAQPHVAVSALMLEENGRRPVEEPRARVQLHDARERARASVAEEIAAALEHVAAVHPALAHHLRASLQIGVLCVYDPEAEESERTEAAPARHAASAQASARRGGPSTPPSGALRFAALGR
ncbi:MAG: hypothetical protein SF182_07805 [Deltaproteobacteria bacterium]|nr:hypothetical protein [Deltaproteobacteria bacterium]